MQRKIWLSEYNKIKDFEFKVCQAWEECVNELTLS